MLADTAVKTNKQTKNKKNTAFFWSQCRTQIFKEYLLSLLRSFYPSWITISTMWPSSKPCAVKTSWMKEMRLPFKQHELEGLSLNHPDFLHSAAACLWFQCHGQLMWTNSLLKLVCRDAHTLGLVATSSGSICLLNVSWRSPLCGPLTCWGERQSPSHLCLLHHSGHLSLSCLVCVCPKSIPSDCDTPSAYISACTPV